MRRQDGERSKAQPTAGKSIYMHIKRFTNTSRTVAYLLCNHSKDEERGLSSLAIIYSRYIDDRALATSIVHIPGNTTG